MAEYRVNPYFQDARYDAEISKAKLAKAVGVSIKDISLYERAKALPHPLVARKLARALNRSIRELFPKDLRDFIRNPDSYDDAMNHAIPLTHKIECTLSKDERKTDFVPRKKDSLSAGTYREYFTLSRLRYFWN